MLFSTLNFLYFYISTSRNFVCSVQYGCFLHFPDFVLSQYVAQVLSDFEMVPVGPIIIGITSALAFHMRCISVVLLLLLLLLLLLFRFCEEYFRTYRLHNMTLKSTIVTFYFLTSNRYLMKNVKVFSRVGMWRHGLV